MLEEMDKLNEKLKEVRYLPVNQNTFDMMLTNSGIPGRIDNFPVIQENPGILWKKFQSYKQTKIFKGILLIIIHFVFCVDAISTVLPLWQKLLDIVLFLPREILGWVLENYIFYPGELLELFWFTFLSISEYPVLIHRRFLSAHIDIQDIAA